MVQIIVAFQKPEDGKKIKDILMRKGFCVSGVSTSGAQALHSADGLQGGILVCGYRFSDMIASEIRRYLSPNMDMLVVTALNQSQEIHMDGVRCLYLPLKVYELVDTLHKMCEEQKRMQKRRGFQPKKRSEEQLEVIYQAKTILMKESQMTELEAHRYIQKCSMDSGKSMIETAKMIIGASDNKRRGI